ncbi:PAS domain-containing sensor histidine kinase [Haloarcula halophila]|uniref:PAS domain-containing sensor histidine kinase n=1 Tax=Haloarcula TaxID=2237 RepID=UPI0023E3E328|nr:PAS domain-containing sensor histidine kinase [Halomicroarcula sp. DFY41]
MSDDLGTADRLAAAVFDEIPDQLAVLDADGTILATNRSWREFGLDNGLEVGGDMVGVDYLDVCRRSDDETATAAVEGIEAVVDGGMTEFSFEYPCHSPDKQLWFRMRVTAFTFDEEERVLISHTDITDRHLAEQEVSDRNDTLELVAGILSHDLQNPLSVALARSEMVEDDAHAPVIERSLERMKDIIDDALLIARKSDLDTLEPVDLETCGWAAWSHVTTDAGTLQVESDATIMADASLLTQLLENLFRNALDHAGPDVTVTLSHHEDGFAVSDDGPGVPPDEREQILEDGFTTDKQGGGTGLGLTIVQQVAEAHGWELQVGQSPDGGATFSLTGVARVPATET